MLVREVMTQPALSLPVGATIDEAMRLLVSARISCLPVVDERDRVVGVVSESDVLRDPLEPDPRAHARSSVPPPPRHHQVESVMTRGPFTTHERADVADVAAVFAERGWKSIPVVHDDRLVGVISRSDVVRALSRCDEEIQADVRLRLASDGLPGWRVRVCDAEVTVSGVRSRRDASLAEAVAASVRGVRRVVVLPPEQTAVTTQIGRR
ncbi:CBS domain-containing protein [Segeticoccus rhizosphaerae]|jgi:CBS domain-containing protein|uniref:CBS domain-containing protein n=1 Tax=Segeticoccus rhizosphaerae TaxID=1104777 RepID=UPI0010C0A877|nr:MULTISPECIES: CBS domain-containing protein [Intrasporangiaceae]